MRAYTREPSLIQARALDIPSTNTILIQRGGGRGREGIPSSRNSSNKGKFRSFRGAYFDRRTSTRTLLEFHLFPCDRCWRARNTFYQATLQNLSSTRFREPADIGSRSINIWKEGERCSTSVITGFWTEMKYLDYSVFFTFSNRLLFPLVRWNTKRPISVSKKIFE